MDFLFRSTEGSAAVGVPICGSSNSSCLLQSPADCIAENCTSQFTIIIFPFLALSIGVVATPAARIFKIPYTLFLLIIGIILGALGCAFDLALLSTSLRQWVHLSPPTAFFYVFLAPLIFEASFNTRWHVFKRLLIPILTAAFVIVILQVGLIAGFQKLVIRSQGWSWWAALMYGSMLSATDPISVTATLKSLGASEFLNTLIEGESLVNDGSAFVLFEAFFENTVEEDALSIGEIIFNIFRLSIGGMLMGVAFGIAALIVLGLVYDEFEVETSLTVIVAFLGFWTAQAPSKLSGVICNVASGLVISAFGRQLITPAVRGPLAEFWELLSWIANTVVFVHAGVLLTSFIWSCTGEPNTWKEYLYILVYFLFLQVIRMGLMMIFRPFMAIRNKWFQWREAVVVGFSGLRGAVSLILALEVAGTPEINDDVRSRVVLWTTGIVGLSLIINGFLVKPLIHALKLDKAEKTREDFLHRARAIMVQRTLMILDSLCIETSFKSARWSYVRNNVLPDEWLEESKHTEGYRNAVEQLMDNPPLSTRRSLELVRQEARDNILHTQINRRLSLGDANVSSERTPRVSRYDYLGDIARYSRSPRASQPQTPTGTPHVSDQFPSNGEEESLQDRPVPPVFSLTPGNFSQTVPFSRQSTDFSNRRSIDADIARYGRNKDTNPTQARIHQEVAALHRSMMCGVEIELTEEDRELRRRLLTAILSHVRALSNASLVEFSVLHNLEEDLQLALDANEEGREYDLFAFLDNRGKERGALVYKAYERLIEGKKFRGETAITTAFIIFGVMTEILKEEILNNSAIVLLQAERLYEGAAALLNRLEALNSFAFEWVESQFAIYVCARKQDDVLDDLLASGIVDDQEFKVIHEELIEVRRLHIRSRQSIFHAARTRLAPRLKPRQLLLKHHLFSHLGDQLLGAVVERFGELVHLTGGQVLQAESGSLVVVLDGMLRPLDDTALPLIHPFHIMDPTGEQKERDDVSVALKSQKSSRFGNETSSSGFTPLSSGAQMHWCFPAYNSFCGPAVTLRSHCNSLGESCNIESERANETSFGCCEIAGSATVWTLPVNQVKVLASKSLKFRLEITRALAREIVLESVTDQRPYALSHFMDAVSNGVDVNTVVGRAFRVLERLPYMTVVPLHAGERSSVHLQGPGVLLNGTVRVSIVDTSGLIGAINLLHEQLTGPALLPAGGLIIEEVHRSEDPSRLRRGFTTVAHSQRLRSNAARDASQVATDILDASENIVKTGDVCRDAIVAHVLIEETTNSEQTALVRLQRWTGENAQVDMNGRFGMNRHIELAPLQNTKIE